MSNLNSFGAIFSFAIEMEDRIHNYYKKLGIPRKLKLPNAARKSLNAAAARMCWKSRWSQSRLE
jgi:hypothetical protein